MVMVPSTVPAGMSSMASRKTDLPRGRAITSMMIPFQKRSVGVDGLFAGCAALRELLGGPPAHGHALGIPGRQVAAIASPLGCRFRSGSHVSLLTLALIH